MFIDSFCIKMFMKKIYFIVLILLFIISCSKKKPILGERKNVFLNNNSSIQVLEDIKNIKISNVSTYKNYYGDNSILNSYIENYKVNDFNFYEKNVASKKFGVKNYFFSSPVIVDNIVYYLDTNGYLVSRNINDIGNKLWKIKIIKNDNNINYFGGKISFYNDVLFISDRINEIISVSKNGKILWRKQLNAIPISTPVIFDNILYVITNDNKLYALNIADGKIEWIHYGMVKDSAILGSANPVIYKDYVIASYSSGELFIIDRKSGEVIFSSNLTGKYLIFSNFELTDIDSTPAIKNDILIATANSGVTQAINLKNMKILWKQNLPSLTNIQINGDFAYLITTDNIVVCLNINNGKIAWFKELNKYKNINNKNDLVYYKSLIFINSKLYLFNNLNEYKIINPYNGDFLDSKTLPFNFYNIPFSLNNNLFGIGNNGRKIKLIMSK